MRKKTILIIIAAAVAVVLAAVLLAVWLLWRRPPPAPDLPRVEPPEGAQLLLLPIDNSLITAGYRNPTYRQKNGYPHYGTDFTGSTIGNFDILASGAGVVLGTEWCDNSLGYIAVIRYDSVFVPATGEVVSLIARYYHMTALSIQKDGVVSANQVIGTIDTGHQWHNHVHLELDADLDYPFHTPQVSEVSSELLNRYPASGDTFLEPMDVLVLGERQRASIHPFSDCCAEKDNPRFAQRPSE